MVGSWPIVELGQVIRHRKDFIEIDDLETYKRCRVKLHAQGIVPRDTIRGVEIRTKRQQVCRAGEFLVAEIDAKVGGFGIVPGDLDGAIVSSHYFLFELIGTELERGFLDYYIRTSAFRDQVTAQGSTNYAAIRPTQVLQYTLPLPPLPEQRRIVARIDELAAKIEEARGLRREAVEKAGALLSAARRQWFTFSTNGVTLGDVAEIIDPNPSHRYPAYCVDGVPIISSSDFEGEDEVRTLNAKQVPLTFYEETLGRFSVGEGDIIFSRKGRVGYARLHPPRTRLAMTHTLCVIQPNRDLVSPRYLLHYCRSPVFLDYLTGTMNPNVGVPTLGLGVIRASPVMLPTVSEQHGVVALLDDLQTKADALNHLQAETGAELDALLPAVLDHAFRGAL